MPPDFFHQLIAWVQFSIKNRAENGVPAYLGREVYFVTQKKHLNEVLSPSMVSTLSTVESFCSANDFKNFIGNACLPRFIVGKLQLFEQVCCVIRCFVHSRHSGAVF